MLIYINYRGVFWLHYKCIYFLFLLSAEDIPLAIFQPNANFLRAVIINYILKCNWSHSWWLFIIQHMKEYVKCELHKKIFHSSTTEHRVGMCWYKESRRLAGNKRKGILSILRLLGKAFTLLFQRRQGEKKKNAR